MIRLFDSHCHLDIEPLKEDYEGAIERAHKAGVIKIINVGTSVRNSKSSLDLANLYPNIWATIGIHPHEAETLLNLEDAIEELRNLAQNDKIVAIGETGLDYFNFGEPVSSDQKESQKRLLIAQLYLAGELNLPVIIHTRDAEEDTLKIIREIKAKFANLTGVIHCFTGNPDFAKELVGLGFYIGFTGFVTFEQEKFNHIRESVRIVPVEKILVETDAPFLAPEPYRGKTNEPAFVVEVAKKVAEIKGLTLEGVAEATYKNTEKVFNIE